jgi:hypothetical protein
MDGEITRELIEKMVRRLGERFDPDQVILFGSHARGTAGAPTGASRQGPGSRMAGRFLTTLTSLLPCQQDGPALTGVTTSVRW